jgi:hypothetical protein
MTIRDDLLPRCTVRVDLRGRPAGTGFFVAPGRVVTCAHVIQPEGPHSPVNPTDITIRDHEGNVQSVEEVPEIWSDEDPDLAILKVATGTSHACVLLDSQIGGGVAMHSYGYPMDPDTRNLFDENGSPTTFESEGSQGSRGWVKFKDGQVLPGMSGSPILSLTTGAVCAVVKRTRDKAQSLGGFGVPVSSLLSRASWLAAENEAAHASDKAWIELLTVEQRQAWRVAQGANVTTTPAIHLIVTVSQDDQRKWWVSACIHPEVRNIAPVEVDLNTVRPAVARLFRAWAARGRITEGEQVRTLGEVLFRAAFPEPIDAALKELLESSGHRVVVSLRFDENVDVDLVNLPWEHLYQPDQGAESGMILAADLRVGFARTLRDEPSTRTSPPVREQFSVLIVAVSPDGADDKEAQHAVADIENLANELRGLHINVIENPRATELMGELRKEYDVVHYVGYGRYDDEDLLAFGGARPGRLEYVSVQTLRRCLQPRPPKVVVLQPCEDNEPGAVPADFAMLGLPLVRLPLPAAVIFQYPLPPQVTASFNEAFYRGLADGKPIDMAVQEGRVQLSLAGDQPRAYASPALFQRDPGELRLARGTPSTSRFSRRTPQGNPRLPAYR